jgi:hypothetical protein
MGARTVVHSCIDPDENALGSEEQSGQASKTLARHLCGDWQYGVEMLVSRPVDARLYDAAVLAEIEMTTNLMIAANESDGPLTQNEVDAALEV